MTTAQLQSCLDQSKQIKKTQEVVLLDLQNQESLVLAVEEKSRIIQRQVRETNLIYSKITQSFLKRNWSLLLYYIHLLLETLQQYRFIPVQSDKEYIENPVELEPLEHSWNIIESSSSVLDLGVEKTEIKIDIEIPPYFREYTAQLRLISETDQKIEDLCVQIREMQYLSENINKALVTGNIMSNALSLRLVDLSVAGLGGGGNVQVREILR